MAALIGGVDRDFGGRQSKNKPPFAHIDVGKVKDVAKEGSVSLRVCAVNYGMCAGNHRNLFLLHSGHMFILSLK